MMEGGVTTPVQSLTPEQERDQYKEKVEHFKVLIRKLQDELQSNKVRREGAETVSKLLQESKQECASLKKRQTTYESVIRNLQSRLETNGLSSDIVLQEGETYIPGQSKRLLDNLTRENNRLRHLIRSKSGDPEEYARLQQYNEELLNERTRLQTHIAELDQVLRSSDNEKDKVVNAMREQLEHAQRELASRDTLVRTLSEESRVLQKQLMDVAQQCQELARKLNERGASADKVAREAMQMKAPGGTDTSVLDENKVLRNKVKEISEMNKRWQQYNAQREDTLIKLTNEAKQLQQRVTDAEKNRGNLAHEAQVEMNRVLDESRRAARELDDCKRHVTRVTGERDRHKRDLENALGQIRALKDEIQKIKNGVGVNADVLGDSTETINALKAQIQICTEDFESERRDRERAQAKIARLEAEIDQLKKENDSFRRTIQQLQTIQTPHNDPAYHYPGQGQNYSYERLAARGATRQDINVDKYNVIDGTKTDVTDATNTEQTVFVKKGPDNTNMTVADDNQTTDDKYVSLNASSISSTSNDSDGSKERMSPKHDVPGNRLSDPNVVSEFSPRNSPPTKTGDILRCPKCHKSFTTNEHPELMEHMEECCD